MTSRDTPKTVVLGGDPISREAPAADGPITPGMFVLLLTAGTVRPHNVAGAQGCNLVAREMELVGLAIDDDYETGDQVLYCAAKPGDRFYAFLADGETVVPGALLESDGAGALQALTAGVVTDDGEGAVTAVTLPGHACARALETVDNAEGGAAARIKVEIV